MSPPSVNLSQLPAILKRITLQSGAEVVFKSNCFEIYGLADETSIAIQLIFELEMVKVNFVGRKIFPLANSNKNRVSFTKSVSR